MEASRSESVRFVINTVDGDGGEFNMEPATTIDGVTSIAMGRFNIEPSPDAHYRLALKDKDLLFTALDPDKTLRGEGIKDGDTLWLSTEQVVGCTDAGSAARWRGARARPRMPGAARPAAPALKSRRGQAAARVRA